MKIIIVTGQTASGKTALAASLARKHGGVLVNFDARHIYKYLDIIVGKDLDQVKDIEFYLHSFVDPKNYFSSFEYHAKALQLINRLKQKNKTIIFVGGTYLYIYNLLYGIQESGAPDWKLRKELEKKSVAELQQILKKQSVQAFESLNNSDRNNPRRLMRQIEILSSKVGDDTFDKKSIDRTYEVEEEQSDGKPRRLNESRLKFNLDPFFQNVDIEFIGLKHKTKEGMRSKMEKRVEDRLIKGAIKEVQTLLYMGYTENDPGLKTIGYQQFIKHVMGQLTLEETINKWMTKELQYAKRQFTFMKRDPNIKWEEVG